jgi:hypothetical protein
MLAGSLIEDFEAPNQWYEAGGAKKMFDIILHIGEKHCKPNCAQCISMSYSV